MSERSPDRRFEMHSLPESRTPLKFAQRELVFKLMIIVLAIQPV